MSAPGCGESAERDAAAVFAANLKDLLLAAPAGSRPTLGSGPGVPHRGEGRRGRRHRQGGRPPTPSTRTSRPTGGTSRWRTLERLVKAHEVELVAIGNGTASRETDRLATDLVGPLPRPDQGGGVRGRRVGVFRVRLRLRASCPTWTSRSAARSPSPAGCRIRWPNWSRSTRNPLGWASTSTTWRNRCWPGRWTRWSRTA